MLLNIYTTLQYRIVQYNVLQTSTCQGTQYSILVYNLDLTGKLGESGPNLDLGGVNLDLSDPYLTS